MPSFCWPLGLGPKPAMTRPLTGHRKPGVASEVFAVEVGDVSPLGETTEACSDCSGCFAGGGAFGVGDASGWPILVALLAGVLAVRTPGMTRRSPIFSVACGSILLAFAMSGTDRPYCRESFDSVSPAATTCV